MNALKSVCKVIDKGNDLLGKIFSLVVLAILAVIMCEVIMRRFFNQPQIWTQDLIIMFFACYIILIAAYGLLKGAFVMVDILFAKLPQRGQYILHLITYIVFFVPFIFPMITKSFSFFMKAFTTHELTYSVWAPVVWPEKFCFFLGITLLAIQGVSEILKQIIGIVEGSCVKDYSEPVELEEKGGEIAC